MSLNWKEIDTILAELDLPGAQLQAAAQSAFDVLGLRVHKKGVTRQLLIALTPGACRMHQTFRAFPKSDKPLRFAQFLSSRLVNGWIEEAVQLGDNRIVRLLVRRGENRFRLYIRLWSNAANVIVSGEDGMVLDAMRRLPKKGETSGGYYAPELRPEPERGSAARREYRIRELPGGASFNERIDKLYAEQGGSLSLESLREDARRQCEGSMGRLSAALERLRGRASEFAGADRLKEYGSLILAHSGSIAPEDSWLEAERFDTGERVRIRLEGGTSAAERAAWYYEQYRKAKSGLAALEAEITAGEAELRELERRLACLRAETNPLALAKLLKSGGVRSDPQRERDKKRPGLSFRRGDWLIVVGRDAAENDELLRRHMKGGDLWLHARDVPGSYVFIKQRPGKTVPLEILLDAGNLAIFYSKARSNGAGDLFYTPVKYLRRAKNAPRGTVIPAQEKNLHIQVEENRLRELERCRIAKG
jgi:predicted ribosome quality control (RQC) complex YloA/Tae2 family protein